MVDLATSPAKYLDQLAKLVDKFALVPIALFITQIPRYFGLLPKCRRYCASTKIAGTRNGFLSQQLG